MGESEVRWDLPLETGAGETLQIQAIPVDGRMPAVRWTRTNGEGAELVSVPWSVREIAQALRSELAAEDAVVGLHASGLVHRFSEFVFPTRSAARFNQLEHAA
jgi:hypothetical protein